MGSLFKNIWKLLYLLANISCCKVLNTTCKIYILCELRVGNQCTILQFYFSDVPNADIRTLQKRLVALPKIQSMKMGGVLSSSQQYSHHIYVKLSHSHVFIGSLGNPAVSSFDVNVRQSINNILGLLYILNINPIRRLIPLQQMQQSEEESSLLRSEY